MIKNILFNRLTATFSSILIAAAFAPSASAVDYTTKAINAYDHNGNLISSHLVTDVQYIEVEDVGLVPKTFSVTGNGVTAQFVMIPVIGVSGYTLRAKSLEWPAGETTAVLSTYYIGETEVTNALYKAVMGTIPSTNTSSDNPVVMVSYNDIIQTGGFLDKLNTIAQNDPLIQPLLDGYEFCLPNRWEWEYAAGGGNLREGCQYSGSNVANEVAWHKNNSGGTTHDVKQLAPNGLGVYDMTGNVWEWIEGPYRDKTGNYPENSQAYQGMSYDDDISGVSYSGITTGSPTSRFWQVGFRLALRKKN